MITGNRSQRILIVDDEEPTLRMLERVLRSAGYTEVRTVSDSRRALPTFREFEPDILLLDLRMPHLDGFAVMRQIVSRNDDDRYLPILVITGELDSEIKQRALAAGAKDFLTKPYDAIEVVLRVRNMLNTRELTRTLSEQVEERTLHLNAAEMAMAERLALVAELRDYRGAAHAQRVGQMSALVAAALGLPEDEVAMIRRAAPLHDIGKIGIPDSILLKPAPLTLDELDVLKTHTSMGAKILSGSSSPILQIAEEIALYHHENWDGTGYTPGLAGESIPLVGRITAVADVYDALVHERPYKKAWTQDDALGFIEEQRGRKFDPAVVTAFFRTRATADLPSLDEFENWSELDAIFNVVPEPVPEPEPEAVAKPAHAAPAVTPRAEVRPADGPRVEARPADGPRADAPPAGAKPADPQDRPKAPPDAGDGDQARAPGQ